MSWFKPVQNTPAQPKPAAPKPPAPAKPAAPADGKVALTANADYVIARDGFSFDKVGTGLAGVADAKSKALNNGKDDLVIQVGDDAYLLSAKTLSVPTGHMPREGEGITVTANGASIQGVVRFTSEESAAIAARNAAAAKARQKDAAAAAGVGAALLIGGALVTGAAVKGTLR